MNRGCLIIFFDARCPFCVGWVRLLLPRDGNERLRFAVLQGEWAENFFKDHQLPHPGLGSIVVWDGEHLYRESAAILRISKSLPGIWRIFRHFRFLPKGFRDWLYQFVANRRYQWFGKYDREWRPDDESAYRDKFYL